MSEMAQAQTIFTIYSNGKVCNSKAFKVLTVQVGREEPATQKEYMSALLEALNYLDCLYLCTLDDHFPIRCKKLFSGMWKGNP